jgi:hypothetical protein
MQIDELIVTLALDPSKFTQGQKEALESFRKMQEEIEKRLKNLEAANKNTGYSFRDSTAAAEGLLNALAGAGMVAFARDTMQSVAATGRMAANIGVVTDELSAFGRMIERNGGNADAAKASLKSMSDQIEEMKALGEVPKNLSLFVGTVPGINLEKDSPIQIYMKFVEWANAHRDDIKFVNLIGRLGGYDQGSINEALKGSVQVLKDYQAAQKGAIDPAQVQAMIRMQDAWVSLDQAVEKTGRDIVTDVEPAFTKIATTTSKWIENNQNLADVLAGVLTALAGLSALKPAAWLLKLLGLGGAAKAVEATPELVGKVVKGGGIMGGALSLAEMMKYDSQHGNSIRTMLRHTFGIDDPGEAAPWAGSEVNPGTPNMERRAWGYPDEPEGISTDGAESTSGRDSAADREKRIRSIAAMLNIDPEIAMHVARHEGFSSFNSTIPGEKSYGDFQLHVTPGHRGRAVGDMFQIETGLDPSDPRNEAASDKFGLEWAKAHGWGDFHGAGNSGIGNWQGIHTGDVNVTIHTDTKSPRDHGAIAADEVRKAWSSKITTQANTGLNN